MYFYTKAKQNKANSVRATLIGDRHHRKQAQIIWLTILKRRGCAQLMIATSTPSQYPAKEEALDWLERSEKPDADEILTTALTPFD